MGVRGEAGLLRDRRSSGWPPQLRAWGSTRWRQNVANAAASSIEGRFLDASSSFEARRQFRLRNLAQDLTKGVIVF